MNILPYNNPVNSQAFKNFVIHNYNKTKEKYIWIITRTELCKASKMEKKEKLETLRGRQERIVGRENRGQEIVGCSSYSILTLK